MSAASPDQMVVADDWSDLARFRPMPEIDHDRLRAYRRGRLVAALKKHDAAMCLIVNPISLRYATEYRVYGLFQSHIPTTYAFVPQEGPVVMHGVYGPPPGADRTAPGRALNFFDGGETLSDAARLIADDVVRYLKEIGTDNRRVAVEYVNPSLTQALLQRGLEVIDGVLVTEEARVIKSSDEIECIRWACAVAELGMAKVKEALRPGVTELQLWGLLNYTNLANNGDWHDGRMLASGPRINPWLQEASERRVESGDLVGFDTDMVGPFGYFADISRTFHCGPAKPTKRQKQLYRLALDEIEHNMKLVRPGITYTDFQKRAFPVPEEFQAQAYVCVVHAVGMCDEYPRINPIFRGATPYDGTIEAGMVICVESYMGAVGERDGVKLEQQVLVTESGCELLSTYPWEDALLD
ncbi:MAG: Xaa-Pro peptidase family protein [Hyphomicrobiaceae bacterium]